MTNMTPAERIQWLINEANYRLANCSSQFDIDEARKCLTEADQLCHLSQSPSSGIEWVKADNPPKEYTQVLLWFEGLKSMCTGYFINGSWVDESKKPIWCLPDYWAKMPPPPSKELSSPAPSLVSGEEKKERAEATPVPEGIKGLKDRLTHLIKEEQKAIADINQYAASDPRRILAWNFIRRMAARKHEVQYALEVLQAPPLSPPVNHKAAPNFDPDYVLRRDGPASTVLADALDNLYDGFNITMLGEHELRFRKLLTELVQGLRRVDREFYQPSLKPERFDKEQYAWEWIQLLNAEKIKYMQRENEFKSQLSAIVKEMDDYREALENARLHIRRGRHDIAYTAIEKIIEQYTPQTPTNE